MLKIKIFWVILIAMILCGCKSVQFELKEGNCGFEKSDVVPCIILTSPDFWVDRTDLVKLIEIEGGKIQGCNWNRVFWTVKGDIKEHIQKIRPKIIEWGLKNRKGQ